MKSLKDYSINITEQEYHDYPAWSYSIIAKYARNGFAAMATLHDKMKPTPEMEFGSLFDSIMTKGKKTLDEYVVFDVSVPPAEKAVLDVLAVDCTCEKFDDVPTPEVIIAAEKTNYQSKWKPETRYSHIAEYGKYYDTIKSGKKLVSKQDWDDAMEMHRAFRNSPYLKDLFGTKNTDEIEYIYQAKFVVDWDIEGERVKVKFMPDLIIVNHTQKTIRLVDLKTSSMPGFDFAEHFVKMRYDIQGELYSECLKYLIENDDVYSEYTILPYLFVDVSRMDKIPVTYEIDLSNGFSFAKGDKVYEYKGWKELLGEILVYEANEAKVPSYITTEGPNDLIAILGR